MYICVWKKHPYKTHWQFPSSFFYWVWLCLDLHSNGHLQWKYYKTKSTRLTNRKYLLNDSVITNTTVIIISGTCRRRIIVWWCRRWSDLPGLRYHRLSANSHKYVKVSRPLWVLHSPYLKWGFSHGQLSYLKSIVSFRLNFRKH